jgi:excisionase family DNA binding protein
MNLVHETYLTVREVAEIFRITHSTVYSWINAGDISAVQVGGSWRIPQSQFERGAVEAPLVEAKEEKADE